jgi:hypothetical protein
MDSKLFDRLSETVNECIRTPPAPYFFEWGERGIINQAQWRLARSLLDELQDESPAAIFQQSLTFLVERNPVLQPRPPATDASIVVAWFVFVLVYAADRFAGELEGKSVAERTAALLIPVGDPDGPSVSSFVDETHPPQYWGADVDAYVEEICTNWRFKAPALLSACHHFLRFYFRMATEYSLESHLAKRPTQTAMAQATYRVPQPAPPCTPSGLSANTRPPRPVSNTSSKKAQWLDLAQVIVGVGGLFLVLTLAATVIEGGYHFLVAGVMTLILGLAAVSWLLSRLADLEDEERRKRH